MSFSQNLVFTIFQHVQNIIMFKTWYLMKDKVFCLQNFKNVICCWEWHILKVTLACYGQFWGTILPSMMWFIICHFSHTFVFKSWKFRVLEALGSWKTYFKGYLFLGSLWWKMEGNLGKLGKKKRLTNFTFNFYNMFYQDQVAFLWIKDFWNNYDKES